MTPTVLLAVLALSLGAGKGEETAAAQVGGVKLKVPKDWARATEETTQVWRSPDGDHVLKVDSGQVGTAGMKAQVCVDKIMASIGGEGWQRLKAGGQPAARRADVDHAADGSGAVETTTYVGCNGKITWSVIYSVVQTKKDASRAKRVVESLRYGGGKK